jgi:ribosomal protein L11 methyltransferase
MLRAFSFLPTRPVSNAKNMDYIQITIPVPNAALGDILIARLSELGFEGFEEEEASGENAKGSATEGGRGTVAASGQGVTAERAQGAAFRLHAYIPEDQFAAGVLHTLLAGWGLTGIQARIGERNWNEEWEKSFQPVVVEGFCAIRAFFHEPAAGVQHDLIITPKMSFGTGHHATTYMMLQAMRSLDLAGSSVLDFGTGTGVLAILAEKLGAAAVLAIDNDDWSIRNAGENIAENHCLHIALEKMEIIPRNKVFSIILANINKTVILSELGAMGQHLAPGGVILLSGLLGQDLEDIEVIAAQNKLTISERMTKDNWLCLKLEQPHSKYSALS